MFKDKYKKDNEKINANPETIKKLSERMKYNIELDKVKSVRQRNSRKNILVAACFLILMIPTIVFGSKYISIKNNELAKIDEKMMYGEEEDKADRKVKSEISNKEEENNVENDEETGYYIPEMELKMPEPDIQASMVPFVIYDGKFYYQSGAKISIEEGKLLREEKLGETKQVFMCMDGKVSSGEKINPKEVEDFAGSIGPADVYKVKGYDEKFRIMTYAKDEYGTYVDIYECLSGITISSGKDIFGKMNIENNIKFAKWDTFDNWNYNTPDKKEIVIDENTNNFVRALNGAIPYSLEEKEFRDSFFYKGSENYEELQEKFLYLELKDGTAIELRLFSNGYVYYNGMNGTIFKLDETYFNKLWSIMVE